MVTIVYEKTADQILFLKKGLSLMDTIIETPGLQHIAEKILQPLKVKDIKSLFSLNQNTKELEGRCNSPKFWLHKISFQSNDEKKKGTDMQQFRLNEFVISWKILISNCKNKDILKKMAINLKIMFFESKIQLPVELAHQLATIKFESMKIPQLAVSYSAFGADLVEFILENSNLEPAHAPIIPSIQHKDDTCLNPLSIAAQFGYLDLAKNLIEKIEKPNGFIPRRHDILPIRWFFGASKFYNENHNFEGFEDRIRYEFCQNSPIWLAIKNGHIDIVKELLPFAESVQTWQLINWVHGRKFMDLGNDYQKYILQLLIQHHVM